MSDLVEELDDGTWLIKPTGEIKSCSRSTAYRYAKKANKAIEDSQGAENSVSEAHDDITTEIVNESEIPPIQEDDSPTLEIDSESYDEITVETPIFDLPSLADLRGDEAQEGESFHGESEGERDQDFINALKGAQVIKDDEGNQKVRLENLLIGDNPLISSILSGCDHALYAWAENKHGMILWDKDSRRIQRTVFVKTLGIIAPKTSIELDPHWVIIGLGAWLYGVPIIRIARVMGQKRKEKKNPEVLYENQQPVIYDGE